MGEWVVTYERPEQGNYKKRNCVNDKNHEFKVDDNLCIFRYNNVLGGRLIWNYLDNTCCFLTLSIHEMLENNALPEFSLPWLPFNITEEQLKIYLTFQ